MPEVLRPDMKALVWLALGFFALPAVMKFVPFALPGSKSAE